MPLRLVQLASPWFRRASILSGIAILGLCGRAVAQDMSVLKHIVFIVKENRTFDVYFGAYNKHGADGSTQVKLSNGTTITAPHLPDSTPLDICHAWKCTLADMNFGKMNRFDVIAIDRYAHDAIGRSALRDMFDLLVVGDTDEIGETVVLDDKDDGQVPHRR